MTREYVIAKRFRLGDIDAEVDAENYLSRTVYEDHELVDIGITDKNGDPIMARKRTDKPGFVRFKD